MSAKYRLEWEYRTSSPEKYHSHSLTGYKLDLENLMATMKAIRHPKAVFKASLYEITEIDSVKETLAGP